jgi:hypothetical protein
MFKGRQGSKKHDALWPRDEFAEKWKVGDKGDGENFENREGKLETG